MTFLDFRLWHETDMPKYLGDVRCWVNSGKHLLAASISGFDPMYGPAVRCKRFSSSWHSAVLHQCIRSLLGAVLLRTIMDISARAISLADRPQRAIWVTSVRMRREDRSSISSFPLADLGGKGFVITLSLVLAMFSVIRLRMSDRAPERSRRCGRACWRVRSPAHCDAAACWPPRSRALARGAPRFSV